MKFYKNRISKYRKFNINGSAIPIGKIFFHYYIHFIGLKNVTISAVSNQILCKCLWGKNLVVKTGVLLTYCLTCTYVTTYVASRTCKSNFCSFRLRKPSNLIHSQLLTGLPMLPSPNQIKSTMCYLTVQLLKTFASWCSDIAVLSCHPKPKPSTLLSFPKFVSVLITHVRVSTFNDRNF